MSPSCSFASCRTELAKQAFLLLSRHSILFVLDVIRGSLAVGRGRVGSRALKGRNRVLDHKRSPAAKRTSVPVITPFQGLHTTRWFTFVTQAAGLGCASTPLQGRNACAAPCPAEEMGKDQPFGRGVEFLDFLASSWGPWHNAILSLLLLLCAFWGYQLIGRRKLDTPMQRTVERAAHRVNAVGALDCLLDLFRCHQTHCHVDPADDEDSLLSFYLASHLRRESSVTGINLARFQRTSEGTQHSASSRGNDVIQS